MAEYEPGVQIMRATRGDERAFYDACGTRWIAFEVTQAIGHAAARSFLIFESSLMMRRVREYPPHWRNLDGPALARLSWGR